MLPCDSLSPGPVSPGACFVAVGSPACPNSGKLTESAKTVWKSARGFANFFVSFLGLRARLVLWNRVLPRMPNTVADNPMSVRPRQTRLMARLRSVLCLATCVFALMAPTTCFLHLTVTSNLRISEEHETHAQVTTRQSVLRENASRTPGRPPAASKAAASPSLNHCFRIHRDHGHTLANGLRAPLRC